jgi:RNA polymerase sigma-70 factor (ECF subfamily)
VAYRVGNTQDVEDLVAETFLSVVRGLHCFEWRHDNSFAAWLFRIAHNLVGNFYRDTARAGHPLPLDVLPEIPAHDRLPEDAVLRKELFARLQELVNGLPARRREVITLKYYAGLRNLEIAEVLGLDERTVASHLNRALADLLEKYRATAPSTID